MRENYQYPLTRLGIFIIFIATINSQTCNIPNCQQCIISNQCTLCSTGFSPSFNFASCDPTNTSFPSGNGTIPSDNNTSNNSSPSGSNNITNCINYTTNGNCSKCSNGYSLDVFGTSCMECKFTPTSPECQNQTATDQCSIGCINCMNGICFQCGSGYQQTGTTCLSCNISNCASCSTENVCDFCSGFYVLTNGTCLPQACEPGYKSTNGFCTLCDPGCSNCSNSQCGGCLDSFYSTNDMCSPCPYNCATCTSAFSCTLADPSAGFTFIETPTGTTFLKCNDGCSSCSTSNWIECLTAQRGFFISAGITLQCQPGCINCTTGKCTQCSSKSFSITQQDGSVSCITCSILCKTCASKSAPGQCTSCFEGFQLINGTCFESCSHNCLTCGLADQCLSCPFNYLLRAGRCLPCLIGCKTCINLITNCSECVAGNYLQLDTKFCLTCSQFCSSCSSTGCNTCFEGYYLTQNNICAPKCILPCATCSPDDPTICHSCILGYNFIHSHTDKCLPHAFFSNDSRACPIGHGKANNSACELCKPANCLYCDGNAVQICLSCKDGFYKTGNICKSCISSCSRCSNNQSCLSCKQGYLSSVFEKDDLYLHCLPCKYPCATCKIQINLCKSCVSGHSLRKNKCQSDYHYEIDITLQGTVSELTQQLHSFVSSFEDITGYINGLIITDAAHTNTTKGRLLTNTTSNSTNSSNSSQESVRVQGILSTRHNSTTNLTDEEKAKLDSKFVSGNKVGNLSILNFLYRTKDGSKESLPPGTPHSLSLGSQMALGIFTAIGCAVMLAVFVRICMYKLQQKKQKEMFVDIVQRTLHRELELSKLEHTLPSPNSQGQ